MSDKDKSRPTKSVMGNLPSTRPTRMARRRDGEATAEAPALVRRALDLRRGDGRVDLLDDLDLGSLEEAVELLEVGLVEIDLGNGGLDLGERQDAHLLPLEEQTLDLFKLLQIYD